MLTTGLAVAVAFACVNLLLLISSVTWTTLQARLPSSIARRKNRSTKRGCCPSFRLLFHRLALSPTPEWLATCFSLETYLQVVALAAFVTLQAVLIGVPLPGFFSWEASRAGYLALANLGFVILFGGRFIPFGRLLGIGIGEANTLHRWLGWCFITLVATHALGYIMTWAADGSLDINLARRKVGQGALAVMWLIPLVATSLPFVRHRFYNLFRAAHLCFLPFLASSCAHSTWAPWFFGAPLVVWVLDRCSRLWTAAEPVRDVAVIAMPGGLLKFRFTIRSRAYAGRDGEPAPLPGQYIYMRIPGVSWGEWHPFSLCRYSGETEGTTGYPSSVDRTSETESPGASFENSAISARRLMDSKRGHPVVDVRCQVYIRARGPFTCRLLACSCYSPARGVLGQSKKPAIRPAFTSLEIDGPYGRPRFDPRLYSTSIIVAGVVGAAPMLGWVQWILEADPNRSACTKVVWVWVAKSYAHIRWLEHELGLLRRLAEAHSVGRVARHQSAESPPPAIEIEQYLHVTQDGGSSKESDTLLDAKTSELTNACCCVPVPPTISIHEGDSVELRPLGTGLATATETVRPRHGRPDLDVLFRRVREESEDGGDIGVLACGPPSLLRAVRNACAAQSDTRCLLHLHMEVFSL